MGQSRMTAEFLLSWWNASNCGGSIRPGCVKVFAFVASLPWVPG